jgi:hypothetical protein
MARVTGHERRIINMSVRTKISSVLGLFAGLFLLLFGRDSVKPTAEDLQRAEFKTSTQRLGIRFGEKIRNVFRFRWLRKL